MVITINTKTNDPNEVLLIQIALQNIASNFSTENLKYISELSKKPNVNEKFAKLKINPMIKTFL